MSRYDSWLEPRERRIEAQVICKAEVRHCPRCEAKGDRVLKTGDDSYTCAVCFTVGDGEDFGVDTCQGEWRCRGDWNEAFGVELTIRRCPVCGCEDPALFEVEEAEPPEPEYEPECERGDF